MNRLLNYNVNNSIHTGAGVTRISGWDIIGKTGTTDKDKDSWYCGLSPIAVSAIWTGHDNPERINNTSVAVNCWQDLMEHYLSDKDTEEYKPVDNVIEARYCTATGLLATEDCKSSKVGYYSSSNMPQYCTGDGDTDSETDTDTSSDTEQNTDSDSTHSDEVSDDNQSSYEEVTSSEPEEEDGEWWTSTPIYTNSNQP